MKSRISRLSYFVMPNEVIEKYRTREISSVDVAVYAALCSLRREYDGVCICQKQIATMCGLTEKTVSKSAERLYLCGLIINIIIEEVKRKKKYKTAVYHLKPLSDNGFFLCPRHIFLNTRITPKQFAMYFFMCRSQSPEYGKSWNSYNDICDKLGYSRGQRSEVITLIGALVELGLVRKTVRRIKKVFVDNIYRICAFEPIKHEKHPVTSRAQFKRYDKKGVLSTIIVPPFHRNVKPQFMQILLI
ncbi:MAG: helix-turn-helix domain-containing protein [Oscillospiraceae bacterium]|nr:helix-turn-helix domain-containing protein [Oscillospiraceae bacterium]